MDQIQELISQISSHEQDLNWLANCVVKLSVLLYNLGDQMSAAKVEEGRTLVGYLDLKLGESEKRMSVAEAEKRAFTDTTGMYDKLRMNYQSLIEIIQSIKKKLDITSQQLKTGI